MLMRLLPALAALLAVAPAAHAQTMKKCKDLTAAEIAAIEQKGGKLPDLTTEKLRAFHVDTSEGKRLLRFGNGITNIGTGPFQIRPVTADGRTKGIQQIYDNYSATNAKLVAECEASDYEYHPQHDHWHMAAVALYGIYTYAGQRLTDRDAQKVSFCLVDYYRLWPNAPLRKYAGCNNGVQGISVGWMDYYASTLPDQYLDIAGLADGRYWIRSRANAAGNFLEKTKANDGMWALVELKNGDVRVLWQGQ